MQRTISDQLRALARRYPVVLLTGARGSGKSTLLTQFFESQAANGVSTSGQPRSKNYVSLASPTERALAREDPELFLQRYGAPLVIDEIQLAPELLPAICRRIDRSLTPGQFFLLCPQMAGFTQALRETLGGRIGALTLYPLSRAELLATTARPFLPASIVASKSDETAETIYERILRGGMPALAAQQELSPGEYFPDYLGAFLARDVFSVLSVRREADYLRFLACLAARTGRELNYADLAAAVGIDPKTADAWLTPLVTAGLVFLLSPYDGKTTRRVVKRPKLYFMDTGLACWLSRWNDARTLEIGAMAAPMFETYVVSEIIKSWANAGRDVLSGLSYYRDNNGRELTLLLRDAGKLWPVIVRNSAAPGRDALRELSVLKSFAEPLGAPSIVCLAPRVDTLDGGIRVLPVGTI